MNDWQLTGFFVLAGMVGFGFVGPLAREAL
jgi:hypothetical protein